MIGAKKLTRKTWLHVSMSVSTVPIRLPSAAFGEIAALLTSACSAPPSSRLRISEIARVVSVWSARSTWMWSSGPASHGQSSGKACREQVMTRQPAEEKRITVAWPMPRLAPVRSSVRRGVLAEVTINGFSHSPSWPGLSRPSTSCFVAIPKEDVDARHKAGHDDFLGIQPHFAPGLVSPLAAEFDAVVQAERAVVPELETLRRDAPAAPALTAAAPRR